MKKVEVFASHMSSIDAGSLFDFHILKFPLLMPAKFWNETFSQFLKAKEADLHIHTAHLL